jgi:hypothetical protein
MDLRESFPCWLIDPPNDGIDGDDHGGQLLSIQSVLALPDHLIAHLCDMDESRNHTPCTAARPRDCPSSSSIPAMVLTWATSLCCQCCPQAIFPVTRSGQSL